MTKKSVCLLSGGPDSAVTLAIAKSEGYETYALSFDYGQRHRKELECAKKIAKGMGVKKHEIFRINLDQIGGSALTGNLKLPEGRRADDIRKSKEIPATYVPARNTIFLSYGLAYAEVLNADAIFIGANILDFSGYPDCRPEYFKKFQEMANLATKRAVEGKVIEIKYPVIEMTKAEIIKRGIELNVPLEYTWSCYKGGENACGICDSCVLRLNAFKEAGYQDPIEYER